MSRKSSVSQRLTRLVPSLALLGMLFLAACGGSSSAGAAVEVSYTFPTFNALQSADVQAVQDAMNVILKPKINVTIKLVPVAAGDYDQKRKLASAAGQTCDIVFTAPWINNYGQNVANGNLLALDTLLKNEGKDLYASLSPATWNSAKINGKIYAVINQQTFPRTFGPLVRSDLATKYGLDLTTINTYADLTPFFAKVKAGEPGLAAVIGQNDPYNSANLGYDALDGINQDQGILGVDIKDPSLKVVNITATPAFSTTMQLARQWYQAGYFPPEPINTDPAGYRSQFAAGKIAMQFDDTTPDSAILAKSQLGGGTLGFVAKGLGTPLLNTGGTTATLNGICASSKNPSAAMKMLNEINTDVPVYRLLADGIAGKNYTVVDATKGIIAPPAGDPKSNGYNPGTPWMFGNAFNDFYSDPALVGTHEQGQALNRSATASPALGFSFDPTNVKAQIAQIGTIFKQYAQPMFRGQIDPATGIPQLEAQLKTAGIDAVIAEMQKQLDAFKAAK